MRTSALAAVAAVSLSLVLASSSTLAGSGNSFLGEPAPEIAPSDWINGDGRTALADFRGDVVLLEFWGTH